MKTYGSEPGVPTQDRTEVGITEYAVAEGGRTLEARGLGSCVAIGLFDPDSGIGGLAHAMLPDGDRADGSNRRPGKYADTAVRAMLREMVEAGAAYTDVRAKIAGGSDMFEFDSFEDGVGTRNIDALRDELDKLGVPIVAEAVGGRTGRSVEFDPDTGVLRVTTADGEREEL